MNIKTLKDCADSWEKYDDMGFYVYKKEVLESLKQLAIKWVKEFQKERTDAISEMFDNPDKCGIYPTGKFFKRIDNFWLEKFNLTEGDLK